MKSRVDLFDYSLILISIICLSLLIYKAITISEQPPRDYYKELEECLDNGNYALVSYDSQELNSVKCFSKEENE